MLGGITPVRPPRGIPRIPPRPVAPSTPIASREPSGFEAPVRVRGRPGPTDIADMPPVMGESLNELRVDPIVVVGRDRKESEDPPPIRLGMNPSNIPP